MLCLSVQYCGLDLGTTYSCVVIQHGEGGEVMVNRQGNRTTPSWSQVSHKQNKYKWIHGELAQKSGIRNPGTAFFDLKRLIGPGFKSVDLNAYPFTCREMETQPKVLIFSAEQQLHPEEIQTKFVKDMREQGEYKLPPNSSHAVISVPAHFGTCRRRITKDIGIAAGFTVVRLISEPTAAALAYAFNRITTDADETIVIVDKG
jgi:molecular chaperone DnaK (HSP70)